MPKLEILGAVLAGSVRLRSCLNENRKRTNLESSVTQSLMYFIEILPPSKPEQTGFPPASLQSPGQSVLSTEQLPNVLSIRVWSDAQLSYLAVITSESEACICARSAHQPQSCRYP